MMIFNICTPEFPWNLSTRSVFVTRIHEVVSEIVFQNILFIRHIVGNCSAYRVSSFVIFHKKSVSLSIILLKISVR
uniref:Uncharacterized protein n=1 Tax=Anguilla anguilla TaxID=7936 RepID=A0A0E9UKY7_ANGAN